MSEKCQATHYRSEVGRSTILGWFGVALSRILRMFFSEAGLIVPNFYTKIELGPIPLEKVILEIKDFFLPMLPLSLDNRSEDINDAIKEIKCVYMPLGPHSAQEDWFLAHVDTTRLPRHGHSYQKPFRRVPIRTQLDGGNLQFQREVES